MPRMVFAHVPGAVVLKRRALRGRRARRSVSLRPCSRSTPPLSPCQPSGYGQWAPAAPRRSPSIRRSRSAPVAAPAPLLGCPVPLDVLLGVCGAGPEELREHGEDQLLALLGRELPGPAAVHPLQEG